MNPTIENGDPAETSLETVPDHTTSEADRHSVSARIVGVYAWEGPLGGIGVSDQDGTEVAL